MDFWFHLPLNPEPWRVGPVGYARRNGKMSAYVGRDQQLDAFKSAVAEEVRDQWGDRPPLEGKLRLEIFFCRHRAKYRTPSERSHRKHDADATNMLKATEDALQGILFENDKDNVDVRAVILEQGESVHPQIVIHVAPVEYGDVQSVIDLMPVDVARKVIHSMSNATPPDEDQSDNTWPPK